MALEVLYNLLSPDFLTNPILVALQIAVVRSIAGFVETMARNGWEKFSFRKLLDTFMRTLPQYLGIEAIVPGAGAAAFVTDYVVTKAKKGNNSVKK